MTHHIRDILQSEFPLTITPELARQLIKMVMMFEIRDEHPLTLNSQMFGVNKFIFMTRDRQMIFDILNINEEDVVRVVEKIPSINREFKVVSDAFNVLCVYTAHAILQSSLPINLKHDTVISVLNYMQYKLMGSAVNHYFPHGANYEIMQTVVESLSMKFSVRQAGSWKKVITERSETMAFDTKAHHNTLLKFDNDRYILYLISDTSTRIRSQLKIITAEYYATRDTKNFISSHSSTTTLDGVQILRESADSFSMISSALFNKILIKSSFIDEQYIKMVQTSVPRLNTSIIRRMLVTIADEARSQMEQGTTRKTKQLHGTEVCIGIEILLEYIVHVIYSTAIHNKSVNINSKIAIYNNARNIMTASRTNNKELIIVRASLEDLFKRTRISSRESTISGLGIVFMLYITLMSFSTM